MLLITLKKINLLTNYNTRKIQYREKGMVTLIEMVEIFGAIKTKRITSGVGQSTIVKIIVGLEKVTFELSTLSNRLKTLGRFQQH